MKKLIIVLMVVALASFLFVGCLGVTPPVDDVDDVDDVVDVAKTNTPIITEISGVSFTVTTVEYTSSIEVSGIAPVGSVIRVYVNAVQTGIGYAGTDGQFLNVDGTTMVEVLDGAKTLYVTATQYGLAESDKSLEYTFTYDTTAPKIASAVADSSDGFITVTFNEPVNTKTEATGSTTSTDPDAIFLNSALNPANWTLYVDGSLVATPPAAKFTPLSTKVIRIEPASGVVLGKYYSISCANISDTQGTKMAAGTLSSYFGIVVE